MSHTLYILGTFDVQSVTIKEYSGYVHITCHFAVGSKLKECKIVLRSHEAMNQGRDSRHVYTASGIAGSLEAATVIVLPNGNYTVDVFDNETEYPAYSTELTISYAQLRDKTGKYKFPCSKTPNTKQVHNHVNTTMAMGCLTLYYIGHLFAQCCITSCTSHAFKFSVRKFRERVEISVMAHSKPLEEEL